MVTKSKARVRQDLIRSKNSQGRLTFLGDTIQELADALDAISRVRFPTTKYQQDPVGFFRDILGVDPWHKQVEVLEAIRDHPRVSVRSGHKVSKSHTIAGASLWIYCSYEDARVVLTSTTARQVDNILWRELRMVKARSGRCVKCKLEDPDQKFIPTPCPHSAVIPETPGDLARTGLKSEDFREISGFTAREAEAVAGISGKNLFYFVDEASGVPDVIFEAIEGNRAGGARITLFGNPTRNEGEHYESFHDKKDLYHTITISSEETPNVVEGRVIIPGLATQEWIEEKKIEWGEESAQYKIRVKGEHATHEDGKIFSIHAITTAETLWEETAAQGRLWVGLDPAGESGTGDESIFVPRRGKKALAIIPFRGLNADGHIVHLRSILDEYRESPREVPVVVIDREGSIGAELHGKLRNYLEDYKGPIKPFELVSVRASDRAVRKPHVYDRMRDELTASLEQWIREGGAIPEDTKLSAEMHKFDWRKDARGRVKITPKEEIRRDLKRSPDRYDALALSVWEPLSLRIEIGDSVDQSLAETARAERDEDLDRPILDPYAGLDAWKM